MRPVENSHEIHEKPGHKTAGVSNSVRRALSILTLLDQSPHPLSFSDIKGELGLPKSTTSHLLSTLESLGYLSRDGENRRYWMNPRVCAPRLVPISHLELTDLAMPVLQYISSTMSLTSFVTVLEGDQVLFLAKADGPYPISSDIYAGRRASALCTAVGKVLLAWLEPAQQEQFLQRHNAIPHTNRTITSKEALIEELKRVRHVGYAIDDREEAFSMRCLAVPVISKDCPGSIAMGVTGTVTDIRPDNIPAVVLHLKQAAQRIRIPASRS